MTLTADDNAQLLNKNNLIKQIFYNYILYKQNSTIIIIIIILYILKIMIVSNQAAHNKMYV